MKTTTRRNAGMGGVIGLALLTGAPAHAQFDPTAARCTFDAPTSWYGRFSEVRTAGRLRLQWSPSTGRILDYTWYFDPFATRPVAATPANAACWDPAVERAKHEGPERLYSTLDPTGLNQVTKTTASSSHFVHASVKSHVFGTTLTGHQIHAQMNPAGGADPRWNFSGILEQTGSGWIAAGGVVSCGP